MGSRVDLHSHTHFSDGLHTPLETFKMARDKGLAALGITDHDTVAGWAEAEQAASHWGISWVPGVEISTSYEGGDIHVLGYFMRLDEPFMKQLEGLRQVRDRRNRAMVEKLQSLGIPITLEEVYARKQDGKNVGRPHIAEVLVQKKVVADMAQAFELYLGEGGRAYVQLERLSPLEAMHMIHRAGGACVLAHPGLYRRDTLIEEMAHHGLDGLEVFHPDHTPGMERHYQEVARSYGLIPTAGSDFHGVRQGRAFHGEIGERTTTIEVLEMLRERALQRQGG